MNDVEITASLEWSKKLKEAGWEQDSGIVWWHKTLSSQWEILNAAECERAKQMRWVQEFIAAPTAEEILRRLPYSIEGYGLTVMKMDGWYNLIYLKSATDQRHLKSEDSLANAAAAMWCYLKNNNLL